MSTPPTIRYAEFLERDFPAAFYEECSSADCSAEELLEIGIETGFMRRIERQEKQYIGVDFVRWGQLSEELE